MSVLFGLCLSFGHHGAGDAGDAASAAFSRCCLWRGETAFSYTDIFRGEGKPLPQYTPVFPQRGETAFLNTPIWPRAETRDTHKMVCAGVCAATFADVSNKNGMRWGVRRVYLYMFFAILLGCALGSAPALVSACGHMLFR